MSCIARRKNLILPILALIAATFTPHTLAGQAAIETQISSSICTTPLPARPCPADSEAYAVAVQPDGKVVVAGRSLFPQAAPQAGQRYVVTVVRYADEFGDLDPSFGTGGIVQTLIGFGDSVAHAVAIQPDGKILVGGGASDNIIIHGQSLNTRAVLLRYLPDGTIDSSFNLSAFGVEVDALALQPDGSAVQPEGSILAVSRLQVNPELSTFSLTRYASSGVVGTIGSIGPVTPNFGCPFECPVGNPLALGRDGSIVFGAGSTVTRFLPNGMVDPSFNFAGFPGTISAVAVQPDGKIVAGGQSVQTNNLGHLQFTSARYLSSGALDPSFGATGVVRTPAGANAANLGLDNYITALAVLPDGYILAGGTDISFSDTHEFTTVFYNPAGVIDRFGGIFHSFYGKGADSFLGAFAFGSDDDSNLLVFATGPVYGSFLTPGTAVTGPFVFAVEEYGAGDANTFTGTPVAVKLPTVKPSAPLTPVTVTFDNVTQDGVTSLTASDSGPTPPVGFQLGSPSVYLYISTTALYSGNIKVCVDYSNITFTGAPRLFHEENGVLVDRTTSVDTANKIVCDTVTSVSPFVMLQQSGPPADNVPPITLAKVSPQPNAAGWNNTNVNVSLNSTDNEPGGSGVKQITYSATGAQTITSTVVNGATASFDISAEGFTTITFFGTDNADNVEGPHILTIQLDKTPPTISGSATPAANANGWNNTNVTVSFQCSDSLSGLAAGSPPAPTTLATEGVGQTVIGTCTDVAGNSASGTVGGINVDKTPPIVICSAMPNVLWPPNNKLVPVNFSVSVSDTLSGPAGFELVSASSNEPDSGNGDIQGFAIGAASTAGQLRAQRLGSGTGRTYTFSYQGSDKAGNTAACSTAVNVPHDQGEQ